MPKVNRTTDRAHVIMSFDLAQRDFEAFISEITKSKFFPNLIGLEVKRPNFGNPVIGLGALLISQAKSESVSTESGDTPSEEWVPLTRSIDEEPVDVDTEDSVDSEEEDDSEEDEDSSNEGEVYDE